MFTKPFRALSCRSVLVLFALSTSIFGNICLAASSDRVVDFQRWQTKQGSQVYYLNTPQLPMLDIKIAFRAGSAYDGKHFGLAALTNDLIDQGNTQLNADQIAENFENLGAEFSTKISRDAATISLRTLSMPDKLVRAIKLLNLVLSQPNFPKKAFDRKKNKQLAAIKQQLQSPATIASNTFFATLYPAHPYGHPTIGRAKSVKKLNSHLVKQFYRRYYTAQNAVIVLVGNVNSTQAHHIAAQISRELHQGSKAPIVSQVVDKTSTKSSTAKLAIQTISFPASQTSVRMGQLGIKYRSPNYFPLIVGNYTLGGGGLVSRLFNQLREQHGLSYAAFSYFLPMAQTGPFVIGLGTRTKQANKAIQLTQAVLANFIKTGPSETELQTAKNNITSNLILGLDSNRAIANTLLTMAFYQLSDDYLDSYRKKIDAVNQEDIKQAFQALIKPNQLLVVRVGKPKTAS